MAKIKLAALDVDGTLVRGDLSLSPAVVRAVESLREAGILVSIVTGRSMGELIDFRRSLPWIRYFVVSNGATGFDAETNSTFYENHLPLPIAREIEREARKFPVMTQVYADGTSYLDQFSWEHTERYMAEHMKYPSLIAGYTPVDHVGDMLRARENDIEKLYLTFEDLADLPHLRAFQPIVSGRSRSVDSQRVGDHKSRRREGLRVGGAPSISRRHAGRDGGGWRW